MEECAMGQSFNMMDRVGAVRAAPRVDKVQR